MSSKSSVTLISFAIFLHFFPFVMGSAAPPALYVLGDSLVDSGNNNFLPTVSKADYFPYGVDFAKKSTGRFTNGRTVADFIAEFLGLPYSPPFLSLSNNLPLTGLNYASGSCGILPETGSPYGKCLKFEEQVGLFEKTVESLRQRFTSTEKLLDYLSKSIFVISIGSNDYITNYLGTSFFRTNERLAPQPFAQLLIDNLSYQLQRLYKLGARKMVVSDLGPIGCIPWITRKYEHKGQCVEDINQLVLLFNSILPSMLQNLTSSLNGSVFVNGQIYSLSYDAVINPSKYGLVDTSHPCCTALFNGTSACIPLLQPCQSAHTHFFWDGFHPTEAVYSIVASHINHTSVRLPFNLNELVNM